MVAIANPPNGTWFQPSPARYSRIAAHRENIIAESTKKGHPSRARPGSAAQFGDPRGWVRTRRRDGRGTHRAQLLPVGGDQPAQAALGRRQGAFPDLAPSESFPEPSRPVATHDARPSSLADVRHGRGGDSALRGESGDVRQVPPRQPVPAKAHGGALRRRQVRRARHLRRDVVGGSVGVTLLPATTVEACLFDRRRNDLVKPFKLSLLNLASHEAERYIAAGHFELALPVALDVVRRGQDIYPPRPKEPPGGGTLPRVPPRRRGQRGGRPRERGGGFPGPRAVARARKPRGGVRRGAGEDARALRRFAFVARSNRRSRSPRSRRRRTTAPARTARRTCAPPSGTCVSRVATNESAITASASRFAGASSGCGWRRRAPPRLAFRSAKGSNGRWRPRRRTPRCRCGGNRRWRAWRR